MHMTPLARNPPARRWQPLWAQGLEPGQLFDIGQVAPQLQHLVSSGTVPVKEQRCLVPGCGWVCRGAQMQPAQHVRHACSHAAPSGPVAWPVSCHYAPSCQLSWQAPPFPRTQQTGGARTCSHLAPTPPHPHLQARLRCGHLCGRRRPRSGPGHQPHRQAGGRGLPGRHPAPGRSAAGGVRAGWVAGAAAAAAAPTAHGGGRHAAAPRVVVGQGHSAAWHKQHSSGNVGGRAVPPRTQGPCAGPPRALRVPQPLPPLPPAPAPRSRLLYL